jgi:hypothetical protein
MEYQTWISLSSPNNDLSAAANDVMGPPKLVSPPLSDQTGVTDFVFVKAPTDYYDRSIESRLDNLGAASIHHRCKRIVLVYCYLTHSLYFFIYHLNLVKFIALLSCNEVFGCKKFPRLKFNWTLTFIVKGIFDSAKVLIIW